MFNPLRNNVTDRRPVNQFITMNTINSIYSSLVIFIVHWLYLGSSLVIFIVHWFINFLSKNKVGSFDLELLFYQSSIILSIIAMLRY